MKYLKFFENYDSEPLNGMKAIYLLKDSDGVALTDKEIDWLRKNLNLENFDFDIDKESSFYIISKSKNWGMRVWKLKNKYEESGIYFLRLKSRLTEQADYNPSYILPGGNLSEWGRSWEKFNTDILESVFSD